MTDYFSIGILVAIIILLISMKKFPKNTRKAEIIIAFIAFILIWPIALLAITYQILTEE